MLRVDVRTINFFYDRFTVVELRTEMQEGCVKIPLYKYMTVLNVNTPPCFNELEFS